MESNLKLLNCCMSALKRDSLRHCSRNVESRCAVTIMTFSCGVQLSAVLLKSMRTGRFYEQEPSPPRPAASVSACRDAYCCGNRFNRYDCCLVRVVHGPQIDLIVIGCRGGGTVAESTQTQHGDNVQASEDSKISAQRKISLLR